jgi:DNA-binding protein
MEDEQKPKSKKAEPEADIVIDENGKEAKKEKPEVKVSESGDSRLQRFLGWYKTNKKKSVPLTVLVLIVLLFGIPWTRYNIAGLVMKKNLNVKVVDSTAGTPVSGADVSLGSAHALTDGSGNATLHQVKVGPHKLLVSKKYYKNYTTNVVVPILSQKTTPNVNFVATGRQVKVSVKNLINHKVLADVGIKVSDINAKTDSTGSAIIVLPVGTQSEKATLSLDGYNDSEVAIKANDKTIQENDFNLTPVGKIYFLSKLSGKIDVVKTNLDGTERKTVLAGSGKEDDRGTVLLASRDWKYLALLSHRESNVTKLYLISTADDNLTSIDGDAGSSVNPVGWSEHNFVYTVSRQNVPNWQPHAQALKSYDAESKKITTLDQTGGDGTDAYNYSLESYGSIYQVGKSVVYEKNWSNYYAFLNDKNIQTANGKKSGIYSISANGSNVQTLKVFDNSFGTTTYITSIPYEANQVYYQVSEKGGAATYYAYSNGKVAAKSDISDDFNHYYQQGATTYLQSPSSAQAATAEYNDL